MSKIGLGINTLEAALERLNWTFDTFDRVYLSFSAGKDSTVMLHLAAQVAREKGRKFGCLLVDLEGQYKLTIQHALDCFEMHKDVIEPYWVCLPIALRNAVSVYEPKWECWSPEAEHNWIRQPPEIAITI
jgi:predicted phosphoadenosine phosphosulfate sulfurtransferase